MIVEYRKQALRDLELIDAYLKENNPTSRLRFRDEVLNLEASLTFMPFTGQKTEKKVLNYTVRYKQLIRFKLKFFYIVKDEVVLILRVIHFARLNPYQS